jgi:hypothetical protein
MTKKNWFKMDNTGAFRLELDFDNKHYSGIILPSEEKDKKGFPVYFRVEINGRLYAYICCGETGWHNRDNKTGYDGLIDAIGKYIHEWYE